MAQYIDKSAVVAEIEELSKEWSYGSSAEAKYRAETYKKLIDFLDNLEVKEGDLEADERMKECPFRQVGCTMYEGKFLECRGACSWMVDYPKLKELKAKHKEG